MSRWTLPVGFLIMLHTLGCGVAQQNPCSIICSYKQQCQPNADAKSVDTCLDDCKPKFEQASVRCKDYYRESATCLGSTTCENQGSCARWEGAINNFCSSQPPASGGNVAANSSFQPYGEPRSE